MWRKSGMFAAALALPFANAAAQETRLGEEGFVSPPATLAQMNWLTGQWIGDGIGGAPAMESWLPAMGGVMVGSFVQQTAEGEIMFTEHLYLMEENGSLALKLKHFNADLTAWEEKDEMLTFRLVAIEECAAYFNALTLRCDGTDGLLAAVRMEGGSELLFRLQRTGDDKQMRTCYQERTTIDINQCLSKVADEVDAIRTQYAVTALSDRIDDAEVAAMFRQSEQAFEAHRQAECGALLEYWREGTIRTAKTLACRIRLTRERTHAIWRNWLTYAGGTPPLLPEPDVNRGR